MKSQTHISLAQDVLGITNPSDVSGSFMQASRILGHELIPKYRTAHALGKLADELGNRGEWERATDSLGLHGMLQGRIIAANTLTDWPVYLSLLERFGSPAVSGTGAQALMVGSQTPTSSRAFERYALTQYNADTAWVVDLHDTETKVQHGSFEQGDGLALRFAAGSMDLSIPTTYCVG